MLQACLQLVMRKKNKYLYVQTVLIVALLVQDFTTVATINTTTVKALIMVSGSHPYIYMMVFVVKTVKRSLWHY